MSKYDNLFSTIETIGAMNPVADDNGVLSVAPTHTPTVELDPKLIAESKARKGQYDAFFENVNKIHSSGISSNGNNAMALTKAKNAIAQVIEVMGDDELPEWSTDKNIIDACKKLRPILIKIKDRI